MKKTTKVKAHVSPLQKMKKTITKRVEKGVRFLDEQFGRKTWVYKIDLGKLDLKDAEVCVLGQSFIEHFDEGVCKLAEVNGDDSNGEAYGFNNPFDNGENTKKAQMYWDILQFVWVNKIKKYRAALESSVVKKALKTVNRAESIV